MCDNKKQQTKTCRNLLIANCRIMCFLRQGRGWALSPAYDLNPTRLSLEKRTHSLSFDGYSHSPFLKTCQEVAPYFNLTEKDLHAPLVRLGHALKQWRTIARRNNLTQTDIKRMAPSFEHQDAQDLTSFAKETSLKTPYERHHGHDCS